MDELMANLTPGLEPPGPVDDAQVGGAAAGDDLLPLAERRVGRKRPAPRVMAIRARSAPLFEVLKKIKASNPELKIIIRGDEEMAYKYLQPVLITCVEAKVKNVNFDTKIVRE